MINGASFCAQGDSTTSIVDVTVIDGGSGSQLASFTETDCISFRIDATSRCPSGAHIKIKTYCSSSGDCALRSRYTKTSASAGCGTSTPSGGGGSTGTTPSTPSSYYYSPNPYIPPKRTFTGAIIGGVVGGLVCVGKKTN